MTRKTRIAALLLPVLLVACGSAPKKAGEPVIEKDVSRIVKLSDGTTCVEPAGLAESRQGPAAVQLKALIESDANAGEVLVKAKELKLKPEEAEAIYFDACRALSNGEIKKEAFEKNRTIYISLRQQFVALDVKDWREKKDGIADAGKLCLVTLPDTDPDHRSFTRVIPADATVNDCAHLAATNGGSEILLGCTKGHWRNNWAKRPIALGEKFVHTKQLSAKGTAYAPDPDCGWN
jgi:hypothetical protein